MSTGFAHANGSVTFSRAPLRPDRSLGFTQAIQETTGGVREVYHSYAQNDIIDLHLRMTAAEAAQFKAFFTTIVRGTAFPFTYTDVFGAAASVRFTTPRRPAITEKAYDAYETTVQLRVQ